jgi:hypothetical protein
MIHYVVTAWGGHRRAICSPQDFLLPHLQSLQNLKHNLSQITVVNNLSDEVCPEYLQTLEDLNQGKFDCGSPISLINRENKGLSYGAFSHVYGLHHQKFEYYIFTEDDYVFVIDDFDKILVEMIEQKGPKCGYLSGIVRDRGTYNEHAGCSVGIIRSTCLEDVWNIHQMLPHNQNTGYDDQGGQVPFSRAMIQCGYVLEDVHPEYGCIMWWPANNEKCGVLGTQYPGKFLFVPVQALFS